MRIYAGLNCIVMLKKERQSFIKREIDIHNKVLVSDLSSALSTSEDTIRRDLQALEEAHLLTKVHGGAISKSIQFSLEKQTFYSEPEKQIIAQKAIKLIKDGMTILLSGGTTIMQLIKELPRNLDATFITMSLPTALALLQHTKVEVIFIGNKLSRQAQMAVGAEVIMQLQNVRADLCFIGTNSIDYKVGITDLEWEIIEVKKAMIGRASKIVSLAISSKLNTVQKLNVCGLSEVDYLVTELSPEHKVLKNYRQKGLTIL